MSIKACCLVVSCAAALVGCGGGGGGDPEEPGAQPPAAPEGPAASGSEATTIAVRKVFLGDLNPDGTQNPDAWKTIGYNLDGIISSEEGKNHCETLPGINPAQVKADGADGIDNGFGKNLLSVIQSVAPEASPSLNGSLESGDFSIIVHLENAGPEGDQSGVRAALYGGGVQKVCGDDPDPNDDVNLLTPCWDGTDEWPVLPDSVNGDDVSQPKVSFPDSYIAGGTWVSGSKGDVDLAITIEGVSFTLEIRGALVSMDLEGRGSSARATNGVIAGVLETNALIEQLRKVAGALDDSLCEGSTIDSIFAQIRADSDIMSDGTNGDSKVKCNGISIALGFEGEAVVLGGVGDPPPEKENPCPDVAR